MSLLRIRGGNSLKGSVRVHGAKNSVLPIMAASILSSGETVIHNCPNLSDVDAATKILRHLGCKVEMNSDCLYIDSSSMTRNDIPDNLMREMRSSVIFLGAILGRAGEAVISMPGGCELGPRPIDLHLSALRAMGAEIDEKGGNLYCKAKKLCGCRIDLAFPSVGATENSMLAASACQGETMIINAAREPEIRDLQEYLLKQGVRVSGAGTSTITVNGANFRPEAEHWLIPDRIVTSTYLSAAAITRGRVDITGVCPKDLIAVTDVLSEMGCYLNIGEDFISIDARDGLKAPKRVYTSPYPGFPTDAQPTLMAASLLAEGTTAFVETIFKNRYRHAAELQRMGADIKIDGRVAIVSGVKVLHGAQVTATDLRGGAALSVAALAAVGETVISEIKHIERGYDDLAGALRSLGADAEIVTGENA